MILKRDAKKKKEASTLLHSGGEVEKTSECADGKHRQTVEYNDYSYQRYCLHCGEEV